MDIENKLYQLNSITGIQMNSYIITTEDEKVIVIDGGFAQDAENMLHHLRHVTGRPVPHVDAWIFTHAHGDHISCFVEIVKQHWDALTVGRVMYNFPSEQYCAREEAWGHYRNAIRDFMQVLS